MHRLSQSIRSAGTLVLLGALFIAAAAEAAGTLTITCLDVGQGDATLIQAPGGRTLLFDGGENGRGNAVIVPFLAAAGIDTLDWIVASHYHADHVGGLDEVLAAVPVREAVYDRGWSYTTLTYADYAAAAGAKRQILSPGQVIDMGGGVTVTCVALNGNGVLNPPFTTGSLENEYDVCLKVEIGGFDYFQAGDLTGNTASGSRDIESGVAPLVGDLDVYHVSHHGSYTSSIAPFLAQVQAEVAVISVGNNSYGHPHQAVLDRLSAYGSFVYQTETGSGGTLPAADLRVMSGHVVISTDGGSTYAVAGDTWQTDESGQSAAPAAPAAPLTLLGNVPNPFNPLTEIRFEARTAASGRLQVYDVAGRCVLARPVAVSAGLNRVRWDGRDGAGRGQPAGVYLYRIDVAGARATGRMVLAK